MTDQEPIVDSILGDDDGAEMSPSAERIVSLLTELISVTREGTTAVEGERRGRKTSIRSTRIAVAIALLLGFTVFQTRIDNRTQTCQERKIRAAQIRAGVVAGADEAAMALKATAAQRTELGERMTARELKEIPDPKC